MLALPQCHTSSSNRADAPPPLRCASDPLSQIILYLHSNPTEISILDPIARALTQSWPLTGRKTWPAHITASGIVLREKSILLVRHGTLGKWLQPGGHVEEGEHPVQAALREVTEETGFSSAVHSWHCKHPFPIDIDVHEIPANSAKHERPHFHVDFRYLIKIGARTKSAEMTYEYQSLPTIAEHNLRLLLVKIEHLGVLQTEAR